ncbi:uncharacterized protein [Macrobrachium rosenbergii]|uniref:uncharacterized protein n=1 Tax=Macrobrachium rosenbergii TaxID=79674 RepID=UPI0034D6B2B7
MEGAGFARAAVNLIILSFVVNGYNERRILPIPNWNVVAKNLLNSDCVDTITCKSATSVAKCTTCDPRYFYCSGRGVQPEEKTCPSGQHFNPDPLYPECILINNCPYHPPFVVSATSKTMDDACPDTIACGDELYVPKCTYCDPRYFYCSGPHALPEERKCSTGMMFNTDPLFPHCVLTTNCPYHPPWTTTSTTTTTTSTTTTTPTTTTTTTTPTTTTTTTTPTTTTTTTTPTTTTTTTTPTTTNTITTPTITTTPFSGCLDKFTCEAAGNFARCNYCQRSYFFCAKAGAAGSVRSCGASEFFNTDPTYRECIPEKDCPYHS